MTEGATGRRINGRRNVPLDGLMFAIYGGIGNGNGGNQSLGVSVTRVVIEFIGWGQFHNLAKVHDGNAVGNVFNYRKIM